MVRMKKVLDNENDKLAYTMECYEYGYMRAKEDCGEGARIPTENPEHYSEFLLRRAAECSYVVQHWADLTDTVTAMQAGEMYGEAFGAGYTEYLREQGAVLKALGPYTQDTARLFRDPATGSYGYVLITHKGGIEHESETTTGFRSETDALAHAIKTYTGEKTDLWTN